MLPKICLCLFPLETHQGLVGLGGAGHGGSGGGGGGGGGYAGIVLSPPGYAATGPGRGPAGREKREPTPAFKTVQRIGDLFKAKAVQEHQVQSIQRLTQEQQVRPGTFGVRYTSPRGQGSNTSPIQFFGMGSTEGRYSQG